MLVSLVPYEYLGFMVFMKLRNLTGTTNPKGLSTSPAITVLLVYNTMQNLSFRMHSRSLHLNWTPGYPHRAILGLPLCTQNFDPMQSTSSEAQITQSGQAIAINEITCRQLLELFSPMFGPHGSIKALVSGGQQLNLTKDGNSLCRDVQFIHPTSILITRAASSLHSSNGDGAISFVLLCAGTFCEAYKFYSDGTSLPSIINSLQLALKDVTELLQSRVVPLTDENLRKLAFTSLNTKIRNPGFLVDIVLQALLSLSASKGFDTNMIEVIKMEGGDIKDSIFVDGLVLDHSGRHHAMPDSLENVCVMTTNMSLEYEKPEVNAEFCYSSASQRQIMAESERGFILEKARRIAELACELRADGKSLVVINEKGIDLPSLEVLADAGVLALRRAKRRNLERLVGMCGGKIITQVSQISRDNLGFCRTATVRTIDENKYTLLEGTPLKGACTILVRGSTDYERLNSAIRGTINSLAVAIQTKCCVHGGISLYRDIVKCLRKSTGSVHECDAAGYQILANAFENLIKILLKNECKNIHEGLAKVFREDDPDLSVVENIKVVGSVFTNAVVMAVNLLMCDEIIKAGRPINQDKAAVQ